MTFNYTFREATNSGFDEDEAAWRDAVLSARAGWLAKWPNHCGLCHGSPGDYNPETDEVVPACSACIESGKCPRCAELMSADECQACHWKRFHDSSLSEDCNQCP